MFTIPLSPLVRFHGAIIVSMMLEILKTRFLEHRNLHPGLEWSEVEHRLRESPAAIAVVLYNDNAQITANRLYPLI